VTDLDPAGTARSLTSRRHPTVRTRASPLSFSAGLNHVHLFRLESSRDLNSFLVLSELLLGNQLSSIEKISVSQSYYSFNNVLEFPDVARPLISRRAYHRRGRDGYQSLCFIALANCCVKCRTPGAECRPSVLGGWALLDGKRRLGGRRRSPGKVPLATAASRSTIRGSDDANVYSNWLSSPNSLEFGSCSTLNNATWVSVEVRPLRPGKIVPPSPVRNGQRPVSLQ